MSNHKIKYPAELKIQAGEMFESGMSGKEVAEKLGVQVWLAYYLEYQGRKLRGILPPKRAFTPRIKGRHSHKKGESQPFAKLSGFETKQDILSRKVEVDSFQVQDFVENNVTPVPTNARFTGATVLFIISAVILYAFFS